MSCVQISRGNMDKIVTSYTSTSQWRNLVTEASQACQISLSEDIESYLVFLLMRFTGSPQIAQKIMAIEYFHSINSFGTRRSEALRDVGDQCLLYSGLFPGRARRRRVRVSYYVNLGKSAYQTIAKHGKFQDSSLFTALALQFVPLMDVLQSMREVNSREYLLDPLQAEELWSDTGSNHALLTLKTYTQNPSAQIFSLKMPNKRH